MTWSLVPVTGSRESLPLVAVGVESIQLTDIRHQRLHRAATSKGATILSPFPSSQVPQAICEWRFSLRNHTETEWQFLDFTLLNLLDFLLQH